MAQSQVLAAQPVSKLAEVAASFVLKKAERRHRLQLVRRLV